MIFKDCVKYKGLIFFHQTNDKSSSFVIVVRRHIKKDKKPVHSALNEECSKRIE